MLSLKSPPRPAIVFIMLLALNSGCREAEIVSGPAPALEVVSGPLPVDFVVCVDNSGSITGQEQALVRETTMLLADLVDFGDRVSVVTFGNEARTAVSRLIEQDRDRIAFKDHVRSTVDFAETRSDIRAGLRHVAEQQHTLFRAPGTSIRVIILLSDGKLEPQAGSARAAFEEIQADLAGPLAGIDIYAVVLGDTHSRHRIPGLPSLIGQDLMRQYIARSRDRYYHARNLNQLLDIAVHLLNRTKGISALGEHGGTAFRIDDTIELMSLIIRKRSTDGRIYYEPADLRLQWSGGDGAAELVGVMPGTTSISGETSVYWSRDYEYFDLMTVNRPHPGNWTISLATGDSLDVLSRIVTPIELQFSFRDRYYLNEQASLAAGIYDSRAGDYSRALYQIRARLAPDPDLMGSNIFATLDADTGTGRYFLNVPADLKQALQRGDEPGTVHMELVAQRWTDSTLSTLDPWFIRRSAPFSVTLIPPFIEWTRQTPSMTRVPWAGRLISYAHPGSSAMVPFGGHIEHRAPAASDDESIVYDPYFDTPPLLTVSVERFDEASGLYVPYVSETVQSSTEPGGLAFRYVPRVTGTGGYRYMYRLAGTTAEGPFAINSPWYPFQIRYGWELIGLLMVVLLGMTQAAANRVARLRGKVIQVAPQFDEVRTLRKRVETIRVDGLEFDLKARTYLFVIRKVQLSVKLGRVKGGNNKHFGPGEGTTLSGKRLYTVEREDGQQGIFEIRNAGVRFV